MTATNQRWTAALSAAAIVMCCCAAAALVSVSPHYELEAASAYSVPIDGSASLAAGDAAHSRP